MISKLAKIQSKTKFESLNQYCLTDNLIRTTDSNQFIYCTFGFLFPPISRMWPVSTESLFKRNNTPQLVN